MFRRVILPVIVGLLLLGTGIAIGASAHDWGHHHDMVVVSGGGAGTPGQTIVVTSPHPYPYFFFPFGLFFVGFLLFLFFGVFRRRRWGGGRGCGPRGGSDDPNQTVQV